MAKTQIVVERPKMLSEDEDGRYEAYWLDDLTQKEIFLNKIKCFCVKSEIAVSGRFNDDGGITFIFQSGYETSFIEGVIAFLVEEYNTNRALSTLTLIGDVV